MENSGPAILSFFLVILSIIILIVYFALAANVGSLRKNSSIIVAQVDLLLRAHGLSQAERQAAFNSAVSPSGPAPEATAPAQAPAIATQVEEPHNEKLQQSKQEVIDMAKQFRADSIAKIEKK